MFCFALPSQVGGAPDGADRVLPLHADHLPGFREAGGADGASTASRGKNARLKGLDYHTVPYRGMYTYYRTIPYMGTVVK